MTAAKNAKSEKSVATAPTPLATTLAATPSSTLSVQLTPVAPQLPLTAVMSSSKAANAAAPASLALAPTTSVALRNFFTPLVATTPFVAAPAQPAACAASVFSAIAPPLQTTSNATPAGKQANSSSLNNGAAPPAVATSALASSADETAISDDGSLAFQSALDQFAATPVSFVDSPSVPDGAAPSSQSASAAANISNKAPQVQTPIDDSSTLAAIPSTALGAATTLADVAKLAAALSTFSPQNLPRAPLTKDSVFKPPPLTPPLEPAKVDATSQPSTIAATADPKIIANMDTSGTLPTLSPLAEHAAVSALAANNLKWSVPDTHSSATQDAASVTTPVSKESGSPQDSASQHSFAGSSDASGSSPANSPKTSTAAPFVPALDAVSQTNGTSTENANLAPSPSLVVAPAASPAASANSDAASANATAQDPAASDPSSATLPNPAPDTTSPNHSVSASQLSQSGGRSEMHIAMQTDNLGAIELHARISGDTVGAAITVEKRDAHTALANDLPALQQALSDKQLRVEQISLIHAPLHSTAGNAAGQYFGGNGNGQPGGRPPSNFPQSAAPAGARELAAITSSFSAATEIFDVHGRLSVHA